MRQGEGQVPTTAGKAAWSGGNGARSRRRQWGADRRDRALPAVPAPASGRALSAARFAIFVTVAGWLAFLVTTLSNAFFGDDFSVRFAFDAIVYIIVVTLLAGSALAYLLARVGFFYRTRLHQRTPRATIDSFFGNASPTLTVLVPSYREEAKVIRETLLSAALQEYPQLRIVLLIDDPPNPTEPHDLELLTEARALAGQVEELLRVPHRRFERALRQFEARGAVGEITSDDMRALAGEYGEACASLVRMAGEEAAQDHSGEFLRREVVLRRADDFATVAAALVRAADEGATLSRTRILQLYRRLAWTFRAELTSFERKRYPSLSQEANKAMNLNSYIGLMGGRYCEHATARGPVLLSANGGVCDLHVPETDYVLTLDADSILLPEYCLRLVYLMEQPEFERVAVAQTPYSAFPGAATRVERIAGATTDLQYIVHQGLTHYGATFWVGANAVLRKRALDEIVETERKGGHVIRRYIQDRTVIEDTESSVDLAIKGWGLYNYPERLSFSATPPDFGSLCIQRQRWANGGLLILEKFRRYMAARRERHERNRGLAELFLRTNYLASITWASFGLVVLLLYPFSGDLLSPIALGATALPYFAAMASDLKQSGYKRADAVRIYGFNLILLPVNLSGVIKSIGQAIGGQKIAFARTPKVRNRTTASVTFVLVPYLIIAFSLFTIWRDVNEEHYVHAGYAAGNALLCGYAVVAFIGIRHSIVDLWLNVVQRLYRPADDSSDHAPKELDWATVLYDGAQEGSDAVPLPTPTALALVANPDDDLDLVIEDSEAVREPLGSAPAMQTVQNGAAPDALAGILGEYVRELRDRGRLVLRLDGDALEVFLEPEPSE
jgi:cellulose synthase/poly-beta-1,6-N-acetylglucosamine synthase-like glycosyltransferase